MEAGLVRALRADSGWIPELSLVAVDGDGAGAGQRSGHHADCASWGAHFRARPLAVWRADLVGTFRSAAPFDDL